MRYNHRTDKIYIPEQIIYEKIGGQRNKLKPIFKRQQVKENLRNEKIIKVGIELSIKIT